MIPTPRRRVVVTPSRLVGLLGGACLVLAAACSTDGPGSTASGITLPSETLAFPSATAKVRTTPVPATTVPPTAGGTAVAPVAGPDSGATTVPEAPTTSGVPTTEVILAICDINVAIADIGPADEGYAFADLRCAGQWATLVAKAFDQSLSTDELIVLQADDGHWTVAAGGGSTTCTSAGIPVEVFDDLGCDRWDRRG